MTHSLTEVPPSAGKAVNVFGEVSVIDDPSQKFPNMSSKLISQPQGIRILKNVSELPVIGGSSAFRFARGYALAKTNSFNTSSGNAVAEYNVYVMHYQFSLTVFKW
ncbi:dirigent protein 19-like [Dioscorea cayenensis subsp. rotundata]|uniref:Dirigent protein n=1 Tax=Dioscorea cayennensis subsp. rotundata TaxID=55577 RepID=A0AB40CG00_DIOCR|nr:dirigent protein 19-like [Dioscorea cayenensis subsp. rotundata]